MGDFNFDRDLVQITSYTDKFWNPGYGDDVINNSKVHKVPLRRGTAETLAKYGTIVDDYEQENVIIRQWPQEGKRPIAPDTTHFVQFHPKQWTETEEDIHFFILISSSISIVTDNTEDARSTGIQAAVNTGEFKYMWQGDALLAINGAAVKDWLMVTGRLPRHADPTIRTEVLVREANYHPDSSQVFYPIDNQPFVVVLAPPGDDVQLQDFEAFYCDGSFGLHIRPFVWHQPLYPISDSASFISKQSSVYACVNFDSVGEFGKLLSIPLRAC